MARPYTERVNNETNLGIYYKTIPWFQFTLQGISQFIAVVTTEEM